MKRNRIIYAIACALAVLAFLAVNSAAALALAVCAIAAPAASCLFGVLAAARTRIAFDLPAAAVCGQKLAMQVTVTRPRPLRSHMDLVLDVKNLLTGSQERMTVLLAPDMARTETFSIPLDTACCGHYVLDLASAGTVDALGLFGIPFPNVSFSGSATVYPPMIDIDVLPARGRMASESGASYDHDRRGQDRSEVFEMRDFHDGDSFKQVHWKLSARFGNLTVREASLPTDYDIALLRDAHAGSGEDDEREDAVNAVMTMLSALSLALLRQGLAHTVICKDAEGAHVQRIDSLAGFEDMMDTVLSMPLEASPPHDIDAFNQVRIAYGITKTMLVTDALRKDALDELAGMTDLSVIHIGEAAQAGADDGGRYLLTHIPAEAVCGGRIKTLEL
ncbi:DUF58 domain-containing protein [uncultured Senegalimassilia sp.]|uniref:DUF58 domain-containing protein n=1 Tax=uncultured Senegalimassilia sp. TaxID=1714350 RepID=UPI0025EFC908|nr:DUF58 domain-containing protein [uncultured Senegalimassilia sp.]